VVRAGGSSLSGYRKIGLFDLFAAQIDEVPDFEYDDARSLGFESLKE
jgi:hypothetical protein